MRRYDVVCIGRACVDEILVVDSFPAEDTKAPLRERLTEGGGQASTAACLAAHLGGRVAFLGVLGEDAPGRFARQRMARFGVDLGPCPRPRGRTPVAFCLASRATGSRTIVYEPSAEPLTERDVPPSLIPEASVILVDPQAEHLLPYLAPLCRQAGTLVVADAEHARPGWERTWGLVDVLAAGSSFLAEAFPGLSPVAALERLGTAARGLCLATLGPDGALAWIDGKPRRFPAPRVEVRDTTGAGDAFHGALALALARGVAVPAAIGWAVRVASLCCRGLGGRSFPGLDEARPFPWEPR
ncbi:carbohydrate kinase family protein [Deferrisoma camini]|uniref:carbohydrate kinase family protein n=1 Tax=Deferrisoma camini TaxID=1035120 RepID=UPI00146EBD2F|nr:PfkB family carbohydrate kinase [Deferrisoma camini]